MAESIVGIDVGAVALSLAQVGEDGSLLRSITRAHEGKIAETLAGCLEALELTIEGPLAATRSTPASVRVAHRADNLVAAIRAARILHPGLGALLLVGGEKFSLSTFGSDGRYRESRFNSLCAAGTGSFLDQQAGRLGLAGGSELAETALSNDGDRPRIATRCAVFAKTDLIHAQQEGYSLPSICDGLCRGLAANVHDALFSGQQVPDPIVFAGGVALNRAAVRHMSDLLGRELIVDENAAVYGAYGAALDLLVARKRASNPRAALQDAGLAADLRQGEQDSKSYYPPLELKLSTYPTFDSLEDYEFVPERVEVHRPVEVDVYRPQQAGQSLQVFMGLDIGSTSTKVALIEQTPIETGSDASAAGEDGLAVVAGFYTRTAGQPIQAVRAIFEAMDSWAAKADVRLEVVGAGTTGSGRKFIGAIIAADLVLDEITAHANAAVALDPQVDTIIEIGGQDAKFTTLSRGTVTQSIMNHVCAAGTGSFIEEQAQRLGCPLSDFAERTAGKRAPLASDRCTVFMERDLNHFLSGGYHVDEVLCSVLHSVRDNYLLKVAREGNIGTRICFQGATAKNRSLVAAFEQRLQKPIQVSRFCHLTGALGVALELRAAGARRSSFRGISLYEQPVPVRTEVCELCHNNCKLRLAEVGGETVGFGYLCGRDPEEERFVSADKSGFDLLRARRRHFRIETQAPSRQVRIGLPAALHLVDDLPLWKMFFDQLGVRTVSSEKLAEPVTQGKRLANAEFCAPIAAWHGHVASLVDRADFIFAPHYLEAEHPRGERRQYCYYTQYAPALMSGLHVDGLKEKLIRPLVHIGERTFASWDELTQCLRPALGEDLKRSEVKRAYKRAKAFVDGKRQSWPAVMQEKMQGHDDLAVVILGRPYTVFSPQMNAGIPEILGKQGIKTFYQDMLEGDDLGEVADLVQVGWWTHIRRLFTAAERVGRTEGLYPVLITSFKCTPDACGLEFFRRIMNKHGKPYLVLQLDEHDSQVGYETRIEAAVRAFRNHFEGARPAEDRKLLPIVPIRTQKADKRTLFIPRWDTVGSVLFAAGLQDAGIDTQLLDETPGSIQRSLGHNTGQCVPLNIIVSEFVESVNERGLDPARCSLWLPNSSIGCNICFFPQLGKGLLESIGGGFEKAEVYAGDLTGIEVSPRASFNLFFAYLFGGHLRRMQCHTRPYEVNPGETDRAVAWSQEMFRQAILGEVPKVQAVKDVVERFLGIEVVRLPRIKVALFGDLYARDNDVLNQDLVRLIEAHGGEALTTSYTEYCRVIAKPYLKKWFREGLYKDVLLSAPFVYGQDLLELPFRKEFDRVLGEEVVVNPQPKVEDLLDIYGLRMHHTGESFDNILKLYHILERHPDVALFVQTNPAFCCPSLVTEAMAGQIESETGVPVVTVTYDGTASPKNDVVIPYLDLAERRGTPAS